MLRSAAPSLFCVIWLGSCAGSGGGDGHPSGGADAGGTSAGAATTGGSGAASGTGGSGTSGTNAGGSSGALAGSGSGAGTAGTAAASGGGASGSGASGGTAGASSGAGGSAGSGSDGGTGGLPSMLGERIKKSSVTVSAGVKAGVQNFSIWGRRRLQVAPVFTAPLADCRTLVCYTSGDANTPTAHVVRLSAGDTLDAELVTEAGVECRGLAAGDGGSFAALLWNDEPDADPPNDTIAVHRYGADGMPLGQTELVNSDNHPTDFGLGEARLEFGGGRYAAYYHVHSLSGHEGDTFKYVDAASGAETTRWDWGCSHSMSNLLSYNATASVLMSACVTDCYPGTDGSDFATTSIGGIYLDNKKKVLDVDAGCDGNVAGELGSAAPSPDGWKLVFNAHQAPATLGQDSYDAASMDQDIGFVSIGSSLSVTPVVWLTTTASVDESDSSIALYQTDAGERYLVGWSQNDGDAYDLALVDPAGALVEGPLDVTGTVAWGRRDDPFRRHVDGDVVWAWFETAGSTTLDFARVDSGMAATCP